MLVSKGLLISFVLCALSATFAQADMPAEHVITVTSDDFVGAAYLDIIRNDDGTLKALSYHEGQGSPRTVSITDLDHGDQPLKMVGDRKVILLAKEADLSPAKGGHVLVKFLYNGVTNYFLDFRIDVQVQDKVLFFSDPDPKDPNSDHNCYTSVFNNLFMRKRTILGKEVGIKDVEPSWVYEKD